MCNTKDVMTHMLCICKLNKHGSYFLSDPHLYHSMVGALQYVTLMWPNIASSVNKALQFMKSPLESH